MKGSMFDVVIYITRRFDGGVGSLEDPGELREELADAGYQEGDVERALAWIRGLSAAGAGRGAWASHPDVATRVPTLQEALKLSAEARGFLLLLERAGILDRHLREAVYERAVTLDLPEIGLDEVRVLVALLLRATSRGAEALAAAVLHGDLDKICH